MDWQPINDKTPRGQLLLYFPEEIGRNAQPEMIKVDMHPVYYPRKPTHWMPIPPRPTDKESGDGRG